MNRITQIGAFFLVALLLLKVLIVPVIYLDFEWRKDYIAKVLCENRNRPQLHCDGKCYLAKRIASAKEKEQTEKGQEFNHLLFGAEFLQEISAFDFQPIVLEKSPQFFNYRLITTTEFSPSHFRPPIA